MGRHDRRRAGGQALVLFGVLAALLGLGEPWRRVGTTSRPEFETEATGWDALGGRTWVIGLLAVLVVAFVVWDVVVARDERNQAMLVAGIVVGVLMVAGLVVLLIAIGDEQPKGLAKPSDVSPLGHAFVSLGGWLIALVGWATMLAATPPDRGRI